MFIYTLQNRKGKKSKNLPVDISLIINTLADGFRSACLSHQAFTFAGAYLSVSSSFFVLFLIFSFFPLLFFKGMFGFQNGYLIKRVIESK